MRIVPLFLAAACLIALRIKKTKSRIVRGNARNGDLAATVRGGGIVKTSCAVARHLGLRAGHQKHGERNLAPLSRLANTALK